MKLNLLSTMNRVCRTLLIATLALVSTGAVKAQTGTNFFNNTITVGASNISLNNASGGSTLGHKNWAIFALSGGVTITDPVATYGDLTSYDVLGNVGLGGAGNLTMTASWINGSVYKYNALQSTPTGLPFITGTVTTDPGYVSTGVSDAIAASNAATSAGSGGSITSGLVFTGMTPIPNGGSGTISLTGSASITGAAATTYVLNLMDLMLSGASAVLTLNGTNTTNYIVNVSRFMTLSSGAKILLGGSGPTNITEANVLFNVKSSTPQYDVTLSGGSEVHGIILAKDRNLKLTGASKVYGEVIAKGVSLSGVSKVINPFTSP